MSPRLQFVLALLLDVFGSAAVLLISTRQWQRIVTPRSGQFLDDTLQINGRTVDAAPTALALVAVAGAIAVIATRGLVRRVVGVVIALAGAATVWRGVAAAAPVDVSRARELVGERHPSVATTDAIPHVTTSGVWPVLTVVCGIVVLIAGALVAVFGARWTNMSSRYESPAVQADPEIAAARRARADAALWTALDRGDDPTESDPRDTG